MILENIKESAADGLLAVDDRAHRLFRPLSKSWVSDALHPLSKLADQPQLRAISVVAMIAGLLSRNQRLVRAGSRMLVAHEAATFAKDAVKTEIERTRPGSAKSKDEIKPKKGKKVTKKVTSFPSGHSAGAIAVARAFTREYPEHSAAAVGAASFLAVLQIVRCAHYPTDVAVGLGVGLAAEKATDLLWRAAPDLKNEEENRGRQG